MKIILLGFRYSGKSSIGIEMAKMNNLLFFDLDEEIEKKANKSINEIVSQNKGWELFRELELSVFNELAKIDNSVIACGGGFAVNNQYCLEKQKSYGELGKEALQKTNALKILFEIDKNTLIDRIKTSYNRPNFNLHNDIIKENVNLYNVRYNDYNSLDYDLKIDTSNGNFINAMLQNGLFCVIGHPVWHSLSPKIHNLFYQKINTTQNLEKSYFAYTKIDVPTKNGIKIIDFLKLFNIQGASITSPFKQEIILQLKQIDEESKKIGAVNTILFDEKNNTFNGYNTDWFGVISAINIACNDISNKKIAIFGSGGGARSAVIGCLKYTKNITMFNRTESKNTVFAQENNIKSCNINDFIGDDFDIIINATTLGLNNSKSILTQEKIKKNHVIFDMVYSPLKTKFLQYALNRKCKIIYGTEMLVYQAKKQFEMFCNTNLSNPICEDVLKTIQPNDYSKCVVIASNDVKTTIKQLHKASKLNDFVEIRFDYIENLAETDIKKVANVIKKIKLTKQKTFNKLAVFFTIFTCRSKKDGGCLVDDFSKQQNLYEYALSLKIFDFFDIDFSNIKKIDSKVLNDIYQNSKIIVSYHNFHNCLTYKDMKILVEKMFKYSDIVKIAVKINNNDDISTMINILNEFKIKQKNIIFAPMCDNKFMRLLALNCGSWTNFFCLDDKIKTANGQISIQDFKCFEDLLNK